jgi:hypothetical protein
VWRSLRSYIREGSICISSASQVRSGHVPSSITSRSRSPSPLPSLLPSKSMLRASCPHPGDSFRIRVRNAGQRVRKWGRAQNIRGGGRTGHGGKPHIGVGDLAIVSSLFALFLPSDSPHFPFPSPSFPLIHPPPSPIERRLNPARRRPPHRLPTQNAFSGLPPFLPSFLPFIALKETPET